MANRVEISLTAEDLASGEIEKVNNSLSKLNDTIVDTSAFVKGGIDFAALASGFAAVGAAAYSAFEFISEFADADEVFVRMHSAGDFAAKELGLSFLEVTRTIKEFSDNSVSDFQAVEQANKLMSLGIVDDLSQVERIVQIAMTRGRLFGRTMTEAMDDISIGVGRVSPEILDNLGFIIRSSEAFEAYGKEIGKTVGELSELERKQAVLANLFKQSESAISAGLADQANSADQFTASLENLQIAAGAAFSAVVTFGRTGDSLIATFLDKAADSLARLAKEMAGMQVISAADDIEEQFKRISDATLALNSIDSNDVPARQAAIEALKEEQRELNKLIGFYEAYQQEFNSLDVEIHPELQEMFDNVDVDTTPIENFGSAIKVVELNFAGAEDVAKAYGISIGEANTMVRLLTASSVDGASALALMTDQMAAFNAEVSAFQPNEGFISGLASQALNLPEGERLEVLNRASSIYKATTFEIERGNHSLEERLLLEKQAEQSATQLIKSRVDELGLIEKSNAAIEKQTDNIIKQAAGLSSVVGSERAAQIAANMVNEYRNGVAEIDKIATSEQERLFLMTELNNRQKEQVNSIKDENKARKDNSAQIKSDFDSIASTAQGILQGGLNIGVGLDFDEILGREDAINEPARRLADIAVKGFDSPWVDYFRNEFPSLFAEISAGGDIKKGAARLARDFEAGLVPELLDLDIATNLVRDQIIGQQNIQGLAEEVASRLSGPLGVGYEQALAVAGQALGSTDAGPQINAMVSGISDAVTKADIGGKVGDAIGSQLSQGIDLSDVGFEGGESYIGGFDSAWAQYVANAFADSFDSLDLSNAGDGVEGLGKAIQDKLLAISVEGGLLQRLLLGEQDLSSLSGLIAERLTVPLSEGYSQAALSASSAITEIDQTIQAEAFARGLTLALLNQDIGGQASTIVSEQISNDTSLERIHGAGLTSGESYATGFLSSAESNIPPKLIRILADLVTPSVLAALNSEQTRTGSSDQ